jgi:integrase
MTERRARLDSRRARAAARGNQLGHGADADAVQPVAVSPVRRADEQESRGRARPTRLTRGGKETELLHDRFVGSLELCCRRGEMLLIQNKRVHWDTCQIGIPGATAKDKENRRIPFNPNGRLAAVLQRRATLGPDAYVCGSISGEHQPTIQTARETLKLLANGLTPKTGKEGSDWNAEQLRRIDLRWHDLRHEGACRCSQTASTSASSS